MTGDMKCINFGCDKNRYHCNDRYNYLNNCNDTHDIELCDESIPKEITESDYEEHSGERIDDD